MLITNNDDYAALTPTLRSMGVKYFFEFEEGELPDDPMIRNYPFDTVEAQWRYSAQQSHE